MSELKLYSDDFCKRFVDSLIIMSGMVEEITMTELSYNSLLYYLYNHYPMMDCHTKEEDHIYGIKMIYGIKINFKKRNTEYDDYAADKREVYVSKLKSVWVVIDDTPGPIFWNMRVFSSLELAHNYRDKSKVKCHISEMAIDDHGSDKRVY